MPTTRSGPHLTVAEVMRRRFITAAPEDTLSAARQTMRLARLRHLVVTHGGRLVGLLSYRELTDALLDESHEASAAEPTISGAMISDPAWVTPETPVSTAAHRLCRYGFGCLPVVEQQESEPRVVGLVTETDLLRAAFPSAR